MTFNGKCVTRNGTPAPTDKPDSNSICNPFTPIHRKPRASNLHFLCIVFAHLRHWNFVNFDRIRVWYKFGRRLFSIWQTEYLPLQMRFKSFSFVYATIRVITVPLRRRLDDCVESLPGKLPAKPGKSAISNRWGVLVVICLRLNCCDFFYWNIYETMKFIA